MAKTNNEHIKPSFASDMIQNQTFILPNALTKCMLIDVRLKNRIQKSYISEICQSQVDRKYRILYLMHAINVTKLSINSQFFGMFGLIWIQHTKITRQTVNSLRNLFQLGSKELIYMPYHNILKNTDDSNYSNWI